jgi:asparagine synthase (glutamine-hydrolysing)
MCGIFAIINNTFDNDKIYTDAFYRGKKRGPEYSSITSADINQKIIHGFHRLAINGYKDTSSEQPIYHKNCSLICNGEIYNFKKLYKNLKINPKTKSDCEIILHLYNYYGIEYTLQLLDGVFAFILIDYEKKKVFIARDTYGVRPLFFANENNQHFFASEMKQIIPLLKNDKVKINQFQPGTYSVFSIDKNDDYNISLNQEHFSSPNTFFNYNIKNEETCLKIIRQSLELAVEKRVQNTDRDIACLLSGGLDSSLIASLVKKYHNKYYPLKKLHTWSIGIKGSEDLKYAKMVAKFIKSEHHSIEVEKSDLLQCINEVIYNIESYDTTSVRASVPNFLISKYIKKYENICDAKVIFNGDGSDELTGGYLYFHYIKNCYEFDKECRSLLKNIHFYDVLRSDRSISSNGLEARTPFLDRNFVQTYLSLPPEFRCHTTNNLCEKYLLRKAFDDGLTLPNDVLWRTKEAFSDGISESKESWFETIQNYIKAEIFSNDKNYPQKDEEIIDIMIKEKNFIYNPPTTLEQLYYRLLFENHYKNQSQVIPKFWMPTYGNTKDASARTLDIYKIANKL